MYTVVAGDRYPGERKQAAGMEGDVTGKSPGKATPMGEVENMLGGGEEMRWEENSQGTILGRRGVPTHAGASRGSVWPVQKEPGPA